MLALAGLQLHLRASAPHAARRGRLCTACSADDTCTLSSHDGAARHIAGVQARFDQAATNLTTDLRASTSETSRASAESNQQAPGADMTGPAHCRDARDLPHG